MNSYTAIFTHFMGWGKGLVREIVRVTVRCWLKLWVRCRPSGQIQTSRLAHILNSHIIDLFY